MLSPHVALHRPFEPTARLCGRQAAEALQLYNEYDPHPPFRAGTPAVAPLATKNAAYSALASAYDQGRAAAARARERRRLG